MSVSFGFYNSKNKDRLYNATELSSIFDGIIADGVYSAIGDQLIVSASSGMIVKVGTGRAWFNHTWTLNDSDLYITIDSSESILARIDSIVLEVNADDAYRTNSIKYIKGTPASSPVAPTLVSSEYVHQYELCNISVAKGVSGITQADITNKVGTTACPFVTGVISQITNNELLSKWESQFSIWFDSIKNQLSTDAAGHLQTEIDNQTIVKDHVIYKPSDIYSAFTNGAKSIDGYPFYIFIPIDNCTPDYIPTVWYKKNNTSDKTEWGWDVYTICDTVVGGIRVYISNDAFINDSDLYKNPYFDRATITKARSSVS